MEEKSVVQVGGNIERAVKGDYQINVAEVLKEAWHQTQASRGSINAGLCMVMLLGMLVSMIVSQYLGGFEAVLADPESIMILNVVVTLAVWPFLAGVEMMGVLHAVGMKTQPKLIFAFLKRASWVSICALLSSLLVSIGLQLFVLPGIFMAVTLSLVIPLVVEKRMPVLKALVLSVKALRFQWHKLFLIYAALTMVLTLLVLPLLALAESSLSIVAIVLFLFGLSYLAPMFYNCKGILYREIFGLQLQTDAATPASIDNMFSA